MKIPSGSATTAAATNEMRMRSVDAQMAPKSVCSKIICSVACSTSTGDGKNSGLTIGFDPSVSTHQVRMTAAGMAMANGTR